MDKEDCPNKHRPTLGQMPPLHPILTHNEGLLHVPVGLVLDNFLLWGASTQEWGQEAAEARFGAVALPEQVHREILLVAQEPELAAKFIW